MSITEAGESMFWTPSWPIADRKFCYIGNEYACEVTKHVIYIDSIENIETINFMVQG